MEMLVALLAVCGLASLVMGVGSFFSEKCRKNLKATTPKQGLKNGLIAGIMMLVLAGVAQTQVTTPEQDAAKKAAEVAANKDALLATPLGQVAMHNEDDIIDAFFLLHEDFHPSLKKSFKVCLSDMAKKKDPSISARQALDWCQMNLMK